MADALWYWHRLRAMDATEMWHRLGEKVRRLTEPLARGAIRKLRLLREPADCPSLPSRQGAPALLKQALAEDAAKLLQGRWSLFGWKEVQTGAPPDWHRDYLRGLSAPAEGRPNHRSLPGGADARTIWEINRWAEPVRLTMHGWLDEDAEAISRAQSWLADWVERNPVGQGINWTSALEGGLRLINFCWFDALASGFVARSSGGGDDDGLKAGLRALRDAIVPAHVWWVRRHLSFGSSANNHRLGELTGLLLAVRRWPEMGSIAGGADELWKQIAQCVLAQFAGDGGNREQALHYHLFAFEMALHACRAMEVTGGPVIERLQRAAQFFVRMSHPEEPWDYGDNDDAQIVPMTTRREKAVAEWRGWMSGGGGEALRYWLLVPPRGGMTEPPPPEGGITDGWWIARESGMAVIERGGWKVRVDASPLGFGKLAAHGHCDALHVAIWDGDRALVIDPGTGGYSGPEKLRAALASWNAHNGPQPLDGFKTPERLGMFLLAEHHAQPRIIRDGNTIQVSIEHEGIELLRKVTIQDEELVIEDLLPSGGALTSTWILAPECAVAGAARAEGALSVSRDGREWNFSFEGEGLELNAGRRQVSRCFGAVESAESIRVTANGRVRLAVHRGAKSQLRSSKQDEAQLATTFQA